MQVSYCSPACQKQHWRAHKPHCKPFRVVAVAGKGLGLVATRIIRRAELVIKEQPLLVKVKGGQTLEAQYRGLGPEQQAALLGLHHDNPGDTLARRLEVIFRANGCEVRLDDSGSSVAGVYPTIPRMNHSCAPSVVWSYARADLMAKEVRALRDIQPGEELCPNYIDSFEREETCCSAGGGLTAGATSAAWRRRSWGGTTS